MFRQLVKSLSLSMILLAVSAFAQSGRLSTFKIPFDFTAGNQQFTAGEYEVIFNVGQSLLTLRNDHQARMLLLPIAVNGNRVEEKPKLVFNRYGNNYFLSQFWLPESNFGRQMYTSRRERELAQTAGKDKVAYVASGRTTK